MRSVIIQDRVLRWYIVSFAEVPRLDAYTSGWDARSDESLAVRLHRERFYIQTVFQGFLLPSHEHKVGARTG